MDPFISGIDDTCPNIPTGAGAVNIFLTLINALFAAKCSLDQSSLYPPDSSSLINDGDSFDFIVIGSGAGGSAAAYELSSVNDWRVLVLEAGGLPSTDSEIPGLSGTLEYTDEDWQFDMEPNQNALLALKNHSNIWHRGKLLGGTTSINFLAYVRGQHLDYNGWASLGNTGWDWDSVHPIFLENENLTSQGLGDNYGEAGPLKITWDNRPNDTLNDAIWAAAPRIGAEILQTEGIGIFEMVTTTYNGFRQNAAKAFLGAAKNRTNLLLSYNSYAEKIIIENNKATGVIVNIGGKNLTLNAAKEVIVAGGVVNSAQLLQLSGVGPEDNLRSVGIEPIVNLPVGGNLHDHAWYLGLNYRVPSLNNYTAVTLDDIYEYIMYKTTPIFAIGTSRISAFTGSNGSDVRENLLGILPTPVNGFSDLYQYFTLEDNYTDILNEASQNASIIQFGLWMLDPISRGQISLRTSDPYDKPIISLEFLQYEEEVQKILNGIHFVRELVSTPPLSNLGFELVDLPVDECDVYEQYSDDYYRCHIRWFVTIGYHPVGTCKMGNDTTAVVDDRLRVNGIEGLRVMDASIMPQVTKGNTQAPTMMIGRKGGIMVKEDWGVA